MTLYMKFREEREDERILALQNLMSSMSLTLEQAMEALKYPLDQTEYYRSRIESKQCQAPV